MNSVQVQIQAFVLKTRSIFPFAQIYGLIYFLLPLVISIVLSLSKDVLCVYKDRKHREDLVYGSSDIDIGVVLKNACDEENVYKFFSFLNLVQRLLPLIEPFTIFKESELLNTLRAGIDRKYTRSTVLLKRKGFHVPAVSTSQEKRKNLSPLLFCDLSLSYYNAMKLKNTSAIRHCCNSFVKLTRNLYPQCSGGSNYAACEKFLDSADPGIARAKKIYSFYMRICRGEKVSLGEIENDLPKAYLSSMDLILHHLTQDDISFPENTGTRVTVTNLSLPQENQSAVSDRISPGIRAFCESQAHVIKSAILASAPCTNFGYFLYFILNDNLGDTEYLEAISCIKKAYPDDLLFGAVGSYHIYFSLHMPEILRFSGLNYINKFRHAGCLPVEYYYLKRHGKTIYGENIIENLIEPGRGELLENTLRFSSSLPSKVRWAFMGKRIGRIVAYLYCILPATRLVLEHGIITTTPGEALVEYRKHYGKEAAWLEDTYETYNKNLRPTEIRTSATESHLRDWYLHADKLLYNITSRTSEILQNSTS